MEKKNTKAAYNQQKNAPVAKDPEDPRNHAIDRCVDGVTEFCKSNPKTAKRIGGCILTGTGIGVTAAGIAWFVS